MQKNLNEDIEKILMEGNKNSQNEFIRFLRNALLAIVGFIVLTLFATIICAIIGLPGSEKFGTLIAIVVMVIVVYHRGRRIH